MLQSDEPDLSQQIGSDCQDRNGGARAVAQGGRQSAGEDTREKIEDDPSAEPALSEAEWAQGRLGRRRARCARLGAVCHNMKPVTVQPLPLA